MLLKKLRLIGFAALFLAASCSDDVNQQSDDTSADPANDSIKAASAENIFYSIPSPIETASLLKRAGAKFDKSILNKLENKDKYATIKGRALNLGVYGADLSYTAIFDNAQESMLYLSVAKNLADGLGITKAFDSERISRLEANLTDRDSMLNLISDSYWETDAYLKENDRGNVSALIILGGWVEGLYIATKMERQLAKTVANKEIKTRIAEQKLSLESLIQLVESYESPETFGEILTGLKELKTIYDAVSVTENVNTSAKSDTGVPTIGVSNTLNITEDQLVQIAAKTEELRNKIINTN